MAVNLQGSMLLLHGPPKVGKTQLASSFPGPVVFLATEPGHKYLPKDQQEARVSLTQDEGWSKFLAFTTNKPKKKPSTIVIDTVSGLYDLCMAHVCANYAEGSPRKKRPIDHPSDLAQGKGWNAVRLEFGRGLGALANLTSANNITLILIDHSKDEEVDKDTKTRRIVCAMTGQARSVVMPVPDHIWFMGYDDMAGIKPVDTTRALYLSGGDRIEASTRDEAVTAEKITLPDRNSRYDYIIKQLNGAKSK